MRQPPRTMLGVRCYLLLSRVGLWHVPVGCYVHEGHWLWRCDCGARLWEVVDR